MFFPTAPPKELQSCSEVIPELGKILWNNINLEKSPDWHEVRLPIKSKLNLAPAEENPNLVLSFSKFLIAKGNRQNLDDFLDFRNFRIEDNSNLNSDDKIVNEFVNIENLTISKNEFKLGETIDFEFIINY